MSKDDDDMMAVFGHLGLCRALASYELKVVALALFTKNSFVGREVVHEKNRKEKDAMSER